MPQLGPHKSYTARRKPPQGRRMARSGQLVRGLRSLWPMDDGKNFRDLGPARNKGVSAFTQLVVPGPFGGYAATAPSGNFTSAGATLTYPFVLSGPFTISAWAYSVTAGLGQTLISQGSGATSEIDITIRSTNVWSVIVDGTNRDAGSSISVGKWYHMVLVYDGANVSGYLNGTLDIGPVARTANYTATKPATLGTGTNGGGLQGRLSDVHVWNRALSANEIRTLYRSPYVTREALPQPWSYSAAPAVAAGTIDHFTDNAGTTIATLPSNHGAGTVVIKAVGVGTNFQAGDTWTVSGVSGWSFNAKTVVDTTHVTLTLNCPAAASPPSGATGTLTVTNSTLGISQTITVGTPTLTFNYAQGNTNSVQTLAGTGVNTLWANETAAGLISVSGGTGSSAGTPTGITNTALTVALTTGTTTGTETLTDTSTGATATFTMPPAAGVLLPVVIAG